MVLYFQVVLNAKIQDSGYRKRIKFGSNSFSWNFFGSRPKVCVQSRIPRFVIPSMPKDLPPELLPCSGEVAAGRRGFPSSRAGIHSIFGTNSSPGQGRWPQAGGVFLPPMPEFTPFSAWLDVFLPPMPEFTPFSAWLDVFLPPMPEFTPFSAWLGSPDTQIPLSRFATAPLDRGAVADKYSSPVSS